MDELKPCPFCGGTDILVHERTCDRNTPYNPNDRAAPTVRCGGCFASVFGQDWTGPDTAITAWNTRPREQGGVVDEWRPIETTPQGVMILLADMTATEARHWAFVGWKHHWNKDGHVETPSAINRRATHWRPLPQPPALAASLGKSNG